MKKIILLLLFGSVFARAETNLPAPVALTPQFISRFDGELRANNPALAAAGERAAAAAHSLAAVRVWPDPTARAAFMRGDNNAMMRGDEGDLLYGVEQKLPLWGIPGATRRAARAELAVAGAGVELRFQALRASLARALFRAALAGETIAVGEQDLVWVERTRAAAEARYRGGGGALAEVLRLQNERARVADQLITARDRLAQEHAAINRLLNRPSSSPWPPLTLPAPLPPIRFGERLVSFAIRHAPDLRGMREEIRAAGAAADKVRRERHPEVSVGVDNRADSRTGAWRQTEVMLNVSLPFFNRARYRADFAREQARHRAAELDLADAELALREELHGLAVEIDAARRETLLYRDEIIPRSERALAAAEAAWQSGAGMFLDVLESRRALLDARLMSARALSEHWERLADLALRCGLANLEALETLAHKPEDSSP